MLRGLATNIIIRFSFQSTSVKNKCKYIFVLSNMKPTIGYPVPGGIIGPPCSWGLYKYGNLAFQVGGVSDETVKHGYGFCVTRTIK
jgi:hypothetical protein